jgi:NADH-quinone oxidoreductase subunit G
MVSDGWNGFNVLHTAAARVGGLDVGFVPGPGGRDTSAILAGAERGEIDVIYLLAADELDVRRLGRAFVVYQGHHGDAGANRADVILPAAAYTEKDATYVNTEGRVQRTWRAAFPPGEAREDWAILRALSARVGQGLPFDTLTQLRDQLGKDVPHLARVEAIVAAEWRPFGSAGAIEPAPFGTAIADFYLTDPISRASPTMAACSRAYRQAVAGQGTGTHG